MHCLTNGRVTPHSNTDLGLTGRKVALHERHSSPGGQKLFIDQQCTLAPVKTNLKSAASRSRGVIISPSLALRDQIWSIV